MDENVAEGAAVQPNGEEQQIEDTPFQCQKCSKRFKTNRGALQHARQCKANIRIAEIADPPPAEPPDPPPINLEQAHGVEEPQRLLPVPAERFYWGEASGSDITNVINECYEKIVFWRKNLFMLPNGSTGKNYIREVTRLLNAWKENSPISNLSMKAIHIMPALLLQKPSKSSKSKDHRIALERRLTLWQKGDMLSLMDEAETLQRRLPVSNRKSDMVSISKRFRDHMEKGNVNGAIKLLTNNMAGGILPLNEETLDTLRQKHPGEREVNEGALLQGPAPTVNPIIYDVIDETMILQAAKHTKGGAGPSGMDADGWRKPLTSRVYGEAGNDLRKALANVTKKICTEEINNNSLEGFLACRLIPLDKKPGLRPIGVGEVLRRVCGKAVMKVVKKDVMKSCSEVQMCAGHAAGSEAVIHSMRDVFEGEEAEAVLLVDAANAFNNINRKALLHNLNVLCPVFARYVNNCYNIPARLFVIGGYELKSIEGTTQGDPLGMAVYAIGLTPLLDIMLELAMGTNMAAFADDVTAVGKCDALKSWWKILMDTGPLFGYYPQPAKSWLIVKEQFEQNAKEIFDDTAIQISTRGERHLGAVIGHLEFKEDYCRKLVQEWVNEIEILSNIATTQPQSAYAGYISGYQHKFSYFLRTIPGIEDFLVPVEQALRHQFIPEITGGHIVNDDERILLSLPPRLGGLGIKIVTQEAPIEYANSRDMTTDLRTRLNDKNQTGGGKTITQIKNERRFRSNEKLKQVMERMSDESKRLNEANKQTGASNWVTSLPIKELNYDLNKGQFWDAIRIRYGWAIPRLPTTCVCGKKFDITHVLSCKKGGFVNQRHNEVRNITGMLLEEVCRDVRKEPLLLALNGEHLQQRSAIKSAEARLDISATGFWTPGQRVFLDVRVFDLNAQRYRGLELKKCFERNENEKKRCYGERVLQVENGTFTPLVFSSNGGMARECKQFYKHLAEMISEKRNIDYSVATNFIRTRLAFSLLRSTLLCLRGSRSFHRDNEHGLMDMDFANNVSHIPQD